MLMSNPLGIDVHVLRLTANADEPKVLARRHSVCVSNGVMRTVLTGLFKFDGQ